MSKLIFNSAFYAKLCTSQQIRKEPRIPTTTASQSTPPSLAERRMNEERLPLSVCRQAAVKRRLLECRPLVLGTRQHAEFNLENAGRSLMCYQASWYMLKWAHWRCLTSVSARTSWQWAQYNTVPHVASRGKDAVGSPSLFYHSNTSITCWFSYCNCLSHTNSNLTFTLCWCIKNVKAGSGNSK